MIGDYNAKRAKAEKLHHSRLLAAGKVSSHPEVKALLQFVYAEMEAQGLTFTRHAKKIKDHIRTIVLDLYDAHVTDPDLYWGYARSRNDYGPDSRNKALFLTYRITTKVADFLIDNGYVDSPMGFYDRKNPVAGKKAINGCLY